MVVTKVAEFRQIEDGFLLLKFVIFIVVDFDEALTDEVHFLHITLVTNDTLSWGRNTAIHLNNQLVSEATLALLEEMVEGSLELFEDASVLDQICLHLWSNLLIELEFFDNEVEIVEECLLNVLSDIVIECWLNMEWLV